MRKITVKSLPFSCLGANSKTLAVVRSYSHKIRVHNYTWQIPFIVVENLVSPLILGTNFMSYSGLILDIPEKKFFFKFDPGKLWDSISARQPIAECPSLPDLCTISSIDSDLDAVLNLEHLSPEVAADISQLVADFPTFHLS